METLRVSILWTVLMSKLEYMTLKLTEDKNSADRYTGYTN